MTVHNFFHLYVYLLYMRTYKADALRLWFNAIPSSLEEKQRLMIKLFTGHVSDLQSWEVSACQGECGMRLWSRLNASTPYISLKALFKFQACLCGEVWRHTRPEFIQGSRRPFTKLGFSCFFLSLVNNGTLLQSPLQEAGDTKTVQGNNNAINTFHVAILQYKKILN